MRTNVFHTRRTSQDRFCKVIIDTGSFENIVSLEMIQKLNLETIPHPKPYELCWLREESEIKVSKRCIVSFSIGKNCKNEVLCDVILIDACHLLLGKSWFYD